MIDYNEPVPGELSDDDAYQEYLKIDEDGNLQINPCSEDSGNKVEIIKIGDMEHNEVLVTVADSGETLPPQTPK